MINNGKKYSNFPYMILQTPPVVEPVSLSELKEYVRVDGSTDDALLTRLIKVARESAEEYMRRSLINQTWVLSYDDFCPEEVQLLRGPIQSVTDVKSIARGGASTTISSSCYYLNAGKEKLVFDAPVLGHIVDVTYVSGFGAAASNVPEIIRQGIIFHAVQMFDNRSDDSDVPQSSASLYSAYKVPRL